MSHLSHESPRSDPRTTALPVEVIARLEPLHRQQPIVAAALTELKIPELDPHIASAILLFGFLDDAGRADTSHVRSIPPIVRQLAQFNPGCETTHDTVAQQLRILTQAELLHSRSGCYLFQHLPGLMHNRAGADVIDKVIEAFLESRALTQGVDPSRAAGRTVGSFLLSFLHSGELLEVEPEPGNPNPVPATFKTHVRLYDRSGDFVIETAAELPKDSAAWSTLTFSTLATQLCVESFLDHLLRDTLRNFPVGGGDILRLAPHARLEAGGYLLFSGADGKSFVLRGRNEVGQKTMANIPRVLFSEDKRILAFTFTEPLSEHELRGLAQVFVELFGEGWNLTNVIVQECKGDTLKEYRTLCKITEQDPSPYFHLILPSSPDRLRSMGNRLYVHESQYFLAMQPTKQAEADTSLPITANATQPDEQSFILRFRADLENNVGVTEESTYSAERLYSKMNLIVPSLAGDWKRNGKDFDSILQSPADHPADRVLRAQEARAAATSPEEYMSDTHHALLGILNILSRSTQRSMFLATISKRIASAADALSDGRNDRQTLDGLLGPWEFPRSLFTQLYSSARERAALVGGFLSVRDVVALLNEILRNPAVNGRPCRGIDSQSKLLIPEAGFSNLILDEAH